MIFSKNNATHFKVRMVAVFFTFAFSYPVLSQTLTGSPSPPDAPTAELQTAPAAPAQTLGTAQITGTVTDTQGAVVPSATITLIPYGKLGERTTSSAADGAFTFTGLPATEYRLTIAASGFDLYSSPEFTLRPGQSFTVPSVGLKISASTTVNVIASNDQIALAEIHEQEQQRVFGVFQNFYTSYIWDAAPMPTKQKYRLAFHALYDPPLFLITAGIAGAEQYNGTFPGYGPGIEGYGKRYGAALADATTARILESAVLPSLLHQDPRYFYQGSGNIPSRAFHAAAFTFTTRGDNGRIEPNYSHMLGSLGAAGISNLYHPAGSRGVGDTFQTFGITLAGNIVGNLFREFVLRHLESVPSYANGKH
jgi:hypothetical protein